MNHTECREAVAFDDVEDTTLAHLEQCKACQEFAEDMRRLEQLAAELAPPPPVDLADRVLAGVKAATAGDTTVVPLRRRAGTEGWRAASRSLGVRLTSAAAVLVLIAAVVTTVVQTQQQDPAEIILASAQTTADAGTAELRVSATTDVVLKAPPPNGPGRLPADPNFASAPLELRGQLETQWQHAMARFEVQLQDFFDEVDRGIDDGTRQIDDTMRQMQRQFEESLRQFGGAPGRGPARQTRPERSERPVRGEPRVRPSAPPLEPPAPPASIHARVVVNGRGTLDFNAGRIALEGVVRTGGGRAPFVLSAAGDTAVYRAGTNPWRQLPGRAGPLGTVVLDPEAILRVAQSATDVKAEGAVSLDGEDVDRYTFTLDAAATGNPRRDEAWRAEALVGADGRMRRLEMTSPTHADGDAQVRTRVSMDLSDFGEANAAAPLPAASGVMPLPQSESLPLYPFNASVRAAQQRRNP